MSLWWLLPFVAVEVVLAFLATWFYKESQFWQRKLSETMGLLVKTETHLHETQLALQTALGGGWQLALRDRDVFLLPESAVLDFTDTLSGGCREQFRRAAKVRLLMDDDLWRRVTRADRAQIPIAFRGLEWRVVEISYPHCGHGILGAQTIEALYEVSLNLVTYATR